MTNVAKKLKFTKVIDEVERLISLKWLWTGRIARRQRVT